MPDIHIIGGGLAGCEAAMVLAKRGHRVLLYEMKPQRFSPAHTNADLAELVCSNSLKSMNAQSAPGMLKTELTMLGSICMEAAAQSAVPAGGSLAVEREAFSAYITNKVQAQKNITLIREEVTQLPEDGFVIVASGPLSSDALLMEIATLTGSKGLSFYDAAPPIVSFESIDMDFAFFGGRYDQDDDYINCILFEEEYNIFYNQLIQAQLADVAGFEEEDISVFEGCMPIEQLAKRGYQTPLFGPMSPKGLKLPGSEKRPFAVVQLRKEDAAGRMYNLVGFQTNLTFGEQRRVFGLIPALKHAEYYRYGVMHRNSYIHSPSLLDVCYRMREMSRIRFAGQITGVEGYLESAASGLMAGLCLACELEGKDVPLFPATTAIGALGNYIANYNGGDYQPMNINFSIIAPADGKFKGKKARREYIANRGKEDMRKILEQYQI